MFDRLVARSGDPSADVQTTGLDPDFSMRVEWLPGGRIVEGELILDPEIDEARAGGGRPDRPASSTPAGLILNLVQEYGDLEYVNLAAVLPSATRNEQRGGRREVYVAQIKQRGRPPRCSKSSACRSGASASGSSRAARWSRP